ncbi:hypothetical protein J4411_02810 [Candidatus Pacearchaeota archaeon]|nr:hypothetical protein [Candidatus Pacearchaeota archaeon]
MFWIFKSKNKIEEIRKETKIGFETVKKDILLIGNWIKHFDSEKKVHKKEIESLKEDLSSLKENLEEFKNIVSIATNLNINSHLNKSFKTTKQLLDKQTGVSPVQTGVQTDVQTPNLNNFSVTERAILFVLLNTDMKLSYEDLAAMLSKEKSTIRGQINTMKSKSENLIEEYIEKNGKKRVYIPEKMKEKLLKKPKVRLKDSKNKEEN